MHPLNCIGGPKINFNMSWFVAYNCIVFIQLRCHVRFMQRTTNLASYLFLTGVYYYLHARSIAQNNCNEPNELS